MVRKGPGRQACRLCIEEIVGYSEPLLYIGRSLQVWWSLKNVCYIVFTEVQYWRLPKLESYVCAKNLIFIK